MRKQLCTSQYVLFSSIITVKTERKEIEKDSTNDSPMIVSRLPEEEKNKSDYSECIRLKQKKIRQIWE